MNLPGQKSLFEEVGEYPVIQKVHKVFYDKMYAHPWLSQFFADKPQAIIEKQQTDFMVSIFGGPKRYMGASPKIAHNRMYITQELLDERTKLLVESLNHCGVSQINQMAWLSKDKNFHPVIFKKTPEETSQRYPDDKLLIIPKP